MPGRRESHEDASMVLNTGYSDDPPRGCCRCCASLRTHFILFGVLGVLCLVIGLVVNPVIDSLMVKTIKENVELKSENSQLYPIWSNTTKVPTYMTFYMYNLTNPEDVLQGGKPRVNLIGPFNYLEVRIKDNITWSSDSTRVSYTYKRAFTIIDTKCPSGVLYPNITCSLDDDMIMTTVNIPLMQIASLYASFDNKFIKGILQNFIEFWRSKYSEETLIIQRPVKEIIWGYTDPILANEFDALIEEVNDYLRKQNKTNFITPLPSVIQIQENDPSYTKTQRSEIYTGTDDINKVYTYTAWAGHEGSIGLWKGTNCPNTTLGRDYIKWANAINGTEALSFRPNLKEGDVINVFSDDIRRSSRLVYNNTLKTKGIRTFRFVIDPLALANASENEQMCAFNAYQPTGTLNMEEYVGGPVYASKHHFLDADPIYLELVDGIPPPERLLHDVTVDVEPHTGSTFEAHQRLQINVKMTRVPGLADYGNLTAAGFYLPVTKVDEHAIVTDDLVSQWQDQVGLALEVRDDAHEAGIITGSVCLGISLIFLLAFIRTRNRARNDEDAPLLGSRYSTA